MTKKKTSYYYDARIEALLEKGKKNLSRTIESAPTMLKVIDKCIEDAIIIYPLEIAALKSEVSKLQNALAQEKAAKKKYQQLVNRLQRWLLMGTELKEIINTTANEE